MIGVTVLDRDREGLLAPSLRGLLTLLQQSAEGLTWVACEVEAIGHGAPALQQAADASRELSFDDLLQLARSVDQVIDGEFAGYDSNKKRRLVLRAVDSTAFDVEGDDEGVASLIEATFLRTRRYDA